jgi:hypothetical protein
MPLEGCEGGTMGVLDPASDQLSACIAEPTEDSNFRLRPVLISHAHACTGDSAGQHPVKVASPP